jgi:hypothetical protein
MPAANSFLETVVPKITGSPAWSEGSLLVVTFDEADSGDASACCGEQPGPNSPNPGGTTQGNGGGRIGAVLLSQYVQPGTTDATPYNHYSLLRSIEDIFGLDHLGFAAAPGLEPFGSDVYNASTARHFAKKHPKKHRKRHHRRHHRRHRRRHKA